MNHTPEKPTLQPHECNLKGRNLAVEAALLAGDYAAIKANCGVVSIHERQRAAAARPTTAADRASYTGKAADLEIEPARLYTCAKPEETPDLIRVDTELARAAIKQGHAAAYRFWLAARHEDAHHQNGQGWITPSDLREALQKHKVRGRGKPYSDKRFDGILSEGLGIFWRYDANTDRLYLVSAVNVAEHLTAGFEDFELRNLPGNRRDALVSLAGTIGTFKRALFHAWLGSRARQNLEIANRRRARLRPEDEPAQYPRKSFIQISRNRLADLFGCDVRTIARWLKALVERGELEIQQNRARKPLGGAWRAPEGASGYMAQVGQEHVEQRETWLISSTYYPKQFEQHQHNGQRHKVKDAVEIAAEQPATELRSALGTSLRERREPLFQRYVYSKDQMARLTKKHGVSSYTQPERFQYLFRGYDRYGNGIWEPCADNPQVDPLERLHPAEEAKYADILH